MGISLAVASLLLPDVHLMGPTVLFVAGAATLHVRGFVDGLKERERRAFEFGRESVRSLR